MTVLILTCEQDVTADMVVAHLNAACVPVVRLDPADLRMLLFGVALVAVMLYRPAGLLPSTRRRREFADAQG